MSNFIPDGWAEYKIKDTANINDRYSFTGGPFGSDLKSEDYTANGVRIIQLQNIGDGVFKNKYKIYTSEEKADALHSCNIYPNDIILSKMGDPVARAVIMPNLSPRYVMASDGIRLAINKGKFDTKFIHDTINSVPFRNQAELNSTGSTRKRIGLTQLRELTFIAPPLPEQQKIAAILTSVDDVIEKTQAQIDKLKDLKTGMMQELLTHGVGVDGKPHIEFKDSPVGKIPKGWDVVKLDALASVVDSMHQTPAFTENGEPMVRVTEIRQSEILNIDGAMTVDEQTFTAFSKNYQPQIGDTLIARVGAYFGATAYIRKKDIFCLGQNTASIRPSKIHDEFLFIYLNSESIRSQMNDAVAVGAQPSLSLKAIKDLNVALPPTSEQQVIAKTISSVRHKLLSLQLKLEQQKQLKKALMQDLLTGKVRVKVDS